MFSRNIRFKAKSEGFEVHSGMTGKFTLFLEFYVVLVDSSNVPEEPVPLFRSVGQ
jgi:hypothetical protein